MLFDDTVRANIAYGREAASDAEIAEKRQKMPPPINSSVSYRKGMTPRSSVRMACGCPGVSGSVMAIARAMLKKCAHPAAR